MSNSFQWQRIIKLIYTLPWCTDAHKFLKSQSLKGSQEEINS